MNLSGFKDLLKVEIVFGELETPIDGVSSFDRVLDNSFFIVSNTKFLKKYLAFDHTTNHGVVISRDLYAEKNDQLNLLKQKCSWLGVCDNINFFIVKTSKFFHDQIYETFNWTQNNKEKITGKSADLIAEDVFIGSNVTIEENVTLMSGVKILGNSTIKAGSVIFPNVSIYPNVMIGKNCRIHSNSVIGSDGFGYKFIDDEHQKIWHYAGVEIQDEVEIGSNTSIDGGTFTPTIIGYGSKIDNDVQIAHNVIVGKKVILCGKAGLAGSCKIGDYTVLGGGACIAPDCEIGVACKVGGGAQVNKSWPDGSVIVGYPAIDSREWKRATIRFQQLNKRK